jgi:hypothetical protein
VYAQKSDHDNAAGDSTVYDTDGVDAEVEEGSDVVVATTTVTKATAPTEDDADTDGEGATNSTSVSMAATKPASVTVVVTNAVEDAPPPDDKSIGDATKFSRSSEL